MKIIGIKVGKRIRMLRIVTWGYFVAYFNRFLQ